MHSEVLGKTTGKNMEILGASKMLDGFYLAGGTGLALWYGHRISLDLDLFSAEKFNAMSITKALKQQGKLSLDTLENDTVHGDFEGTKLSLLYYPYRILKGPTMYQGIQVADPIDIACMKISAISSRGTKKDFVDLFYILEHYTLAEIIMFFQEKYEDIEYNMIHILKGLTYFSDADMDPDPEFLTKNPPSWNTIKRQIQHETKKLIP